MFMNECEQVFIIQKYGQLICAKCAHYHSCDSKLQPAPETWWCPDRCFFYFFFKSKWKTTSKDRCPARVKTLQEQISRPIDADTHCFRYASLLKSSFNSNRFYLYKTANSSAMTNKNTTEEMQIWRERLKIVFSPKMCRTPQSIDLGFCAVTSCCRRVACLAPNFGDLIIYTMNKMPSLFGKRRRNGLNLVPHPKLR